MNTKMKFGLKYYFKPTPKKVRLIGDSLAAASLFVSGMTLMEGYKEIAIFIAISGWVGKFLSNMFADANAETKTEATNQSSL
jgi:hypothetical protein